MVKFVKTFGERPEDVVVLTTVVSFNENGVAEVEGDEIIAILDEVPGYERFVEGEDAPEEPKAPEAPPEEQSSEDDEDEEESSEDEEEPKAPVRKSPTRKAPAK